MSVNSSSSSSNDSLLHPIISTRLYCFMARPSSFIFMSYNITFIILLLPICILVLHLGLQRWCQQRSTSTAAMTSHSDSFTYHLVAMEMICILGNTICCWTIYRYHVITFYTGFFMITLTWYGEIFFHVLTCAERYLAAVHPLTYLSLRRERGIRMRNIIIGCVWLLSSVGTGLINFEVVSLVLECCLITSSVIVIAFCSLSVLRFLTRPGPGEQVGDREKVDLSKRKAFYTIVSILGVLLLRCSVNLVWISLYLLDKGIGCELTMFALWFNIPGSVVLPLLFLHRAGTFVCYKKIK